MIVGGEDGGRLAGGIGRRLGVALLSPFIKQRLAFFIREESTRFIQPLADHLASGAVIPAIGQRYSLDQVPTAMEQMEAGTLTTKSIVTVKR